MLINVNPLISPEILQLIRSMGHGDKFLIDANVFKVGEYKAFVEPYFRDDMSDEAKGNVIEWITVLWDGYLDQVSEARGISNESLK